ncbi:MAG: hypothetical protein AAFY20_03445 [Cyanobacteria bacterium J06639_14]
MTYGDDFVPIDDPALEGPSYPTVFGVELSPKIQGILLALLGLAGAFFLFTQLVQPVQQRQAELAERVAGKEDTLANREENLQKVEEAQAELDRVLTQREGIYSLLGDPSSLDTLLLDVNQQIKASNASIEQAIAQDFDNVGGTQLANLGLTATQIDRFRTAFAEDPLVQRTFYTSELWEFSPTGLSGILQDESYGPELTGKLERQVVQVSFRSLFPQAQNIIRNMERLEPLLIIRDFEQKWVDLDGDLDAEDLVTLGLTRPLQTDFTMEVLVPVGDPREPPEVPDPAEAEEGEEGAEGEEAEAE